MNTLTGFLALSVILPGSNSFAEPSPASAIESAGGHNSSQQHQIQVAPKLQAAAIDMANVTCLRTDSLSCPSAVGMLVIRNKAKLSQCTAFLIADNVMMTNSHCLPDSLKKTGADCSRDLKVFFPSAEGHAAEQVACAKVLETSQISARDDADFALKPDYAIFSISRHLVRKPMELSREGLANDLPVTAYVIDPLSSVAIVGRLVTKKCSARQGSAVAPAFTQDKAPIGVFDNCRITSGNSGSPAVDEHGRVRAIVHATLSQRLTRAASDGIPRRLDDMGYMTNVACINVPLEAGAQAGKADKDCSMSSTREDLVHSAFAKANDHRLDRLASKWLASDVRSPFLFKIEPVDPELSSHVIMPQLACLKNPKLWRKSDAADQTTLSAHIPVWGFAIALDSSYRLRLLPATIDELDVSLSFSSSRLAHDGFVVAKAVTKEKVNHKTDVDNTFTVVECP